MLGGLLAGPGLALACATTRTGELGRRALASPAAALGLLTYVAAAGMTPVAEPAIGVGVALIARHLIWPGKNIHSRLVGDSVVPLLPSDAGRALVSLAALAGGMATAGSAFAPLGLWLAVAGAGQLYLFSIMARKRELQDQDVRDGLIEARVRHQRLNLNNEE